MRLQDILQQQSVTVGGTKAWGKDPIADITLPSKW